MQNNLISQAAQMDNHGVPNDLVPAMNQIGCVIFGPLIQNVLYPFLHRHRINFRPIARVTVGFGFVALSMLYATIVQQMIYSAGPCYKFPKECSDSWMQGQNVSSKISATPATTRTRNPNHVNIWVQTPIYMLISIGEVFAYVTGLEYAYNNAPKGMKAIVQAISLILAGVGSAGAMAMTPLAHNPRLVLFYSLLTILMTATTVIFWIIFRGYDEKGTQEEEDMQWEIDPGSEHDLSRNGMQRKGFLSLRPKQSETARDEQTIHLEGLQNHKQ